MKVVASTKFWYIIACMEMRPSNTPNKAPAPSEIERKIEGLATEVEEEFTRQIAGKTFTVSGFSIQEGHYGMREKVPKAIPITVIEDTNNKGSALWDSQSNNFLFVREPGIDHGVITHFSKILASTEASTMISAIMQKKNIPAELQAEVRKKISMNNSIK
jgi:hypothetical protein